MGTATDDLSPVRLDSIAAARVYLAERRQPVFYLSRTATNLLGVERWVPGLSYVTLVDSWNGEHPSVFVPTGVPNPQPQGNIAVVNWLLRNREVREHIAALTPEGVRPQIVLAFFDAESERLCRELGYDLIMPTAALRTRLDSKIVTTRIGDDAGVPSVPNALIPPGSWDEVVAAAQHHGLGEDLVIQTPYGNSGQTTYFVSGRDDFERFLPELRGQELKVMKRIPHHPFAVDAVLTRQGTIVGPIVSEVTGHRELTRYRGGWAGNELSPAVLGSAAEQQATRMVQQLGERLLEEGYLGSFGVDLLLDTSTGDIYLGEMNPRLTGALSISNLPEGPFAQLPLFAYHLLAYDRVEFGFDPAVFGTSSERRGAAEWSHLMIQHTGARPERIVSAPRTGIYRAREDGTLVFDRVAPDPIGLASSAEVFYLSGLGTGSIRTRGSDLGVLFTRGRVQDEAFDLRPEARALIAGVQRLYQTEPLSAPQNLLRKARILGRRLLDR